MLKKKAIKSYSARDWAFAMEEKVVEDRLSQIRKTNWFSQILYKKPLCLNPDVVQNWCKSNCKDKYRSLDSGMWWEFAEDKDAELFFQTFLS